MSEALLDWHTPLENGVFKEAEYQKKLRNFIEKEAIDAYTGAWSV